MTSKGRLTPLAALLLAVLAVVCVPGRAGAQDGYGEGTEPGQELPKPDIIPRANSGSAPVDAGDRGGSLQLAVFGLVVLALGGGAALVVREARRSRPGG